MSHGSDAHVVRLARLAAARRRRQCGATVSQGARSAFAAPTCRVLRFRLITIRRPTEVTARRAARDDSRLRRLSRRALSLALSRARQPRARARHRGSLERGGCPRARRAAPRSRSRRLDTLGADVPARRRARVAGIDRHAPLAASSTSPWAARCVRCAMPARLILGSGGATHNLAPVRSRARPRRRQRTAGVGRSVQRVDGGRHRGAALRRPVSLSPSSRRTRRRITRRPSITCRCS